MTGIRDLLTQVPTGKGGTSKTFRQKVGGILTIALSGVLALGLALATPAPALGQTFTTLATFTGGNGRDPDLVSLVQGPDGNFYGTTQFGGPNTSGCNTVYKDHHCGNVFEITPAGTVTDLFNFAHTDGSFPQAGLVQGSNGNFYGTTSAGGATGHGTVFEITPDGTLTTLHSFNGTDGSGPVGPLVQASNGNFYGTTSVGGANSCVSVSGTTGCGTVFEITPSGTLTTLHSFDSTDGSFPEAGLVQASNGNFYGTTSAGGAYKSSSCQIYGQYIGCGTVFQITPDGILTTLHSFDGTDGSQPFAGLVQATNGNFYGTTNVGGVGASCPISSGCGTIFEITPSGTLTTLISFDGPDGAQPFAGLVQATDGNFYGTTVSGGTNEGCGTVFKITPDGKLTTLVNFGSGTIGSCGPFGGLVQATDGIFYGTTSSGGASGDGTVFSLSVGL